MAIRTLVVTAADEPFAPLLRGMVESLHQWEPRPFTDLACFDLGLSATTLSWLEPYARHLVQPGWDLPVAPNARVRRGHLRALTVRPFLPRYFPGYDIYVWFDADAWLQEAFALKAFIDGAANKGLAAAAQFHGSHRNSSSRSRFRMDRFARYFGPAAQLEGLSNTHLNAGVVAVSANARHWQRWEHWFRVGLEATGGNLIDDQTALNHAIWSDNLPIERLDARHNWCCHLALPRFDGRRRRLCEPQPRGGTIGIVHLSAQDKDLYIDTTLRGEPIRMSLRFPGARTSSNPPVSGKGSSR